MAKKKHKKPPAPSVVTPEVLEGEVIDAEADDIEPELTDGPENEPIGYEGQLVPVDPSHEIALKDEDGLFPASQLDLLKQYVKEVSKYPLLGIEEEYALAVKLRDTGDVEAARKLVTANLRLVVKIAMEYRSTYQNVMDLIQEGNVGLMKAVSKYDPAKGAKLSYYSSWWIRSYILKYILDNFRLVRVGTTQAQKKLFFHLMREKERLEAQGIEAGPKLLADRLHVREQDVKEMETRLSSKGAELSLNAPVGDGGDGGKIASHQDLLPDTAELQDNLLAIDQLKDILTKNVHKFEAQLKEKELAIFKERLFSDEPKTLQEVADKFGLTRERARQIEVQVVDKLRDYFKELL